MPNLAGFDIIIEFARAAIERELLNTALPSGPNGPALMIFPPELGTALYTTGRNLRR